MTVRDVHGLKRAMRMACAAMAAAAMALFVAMPALAQSPALNADDAASAKAQQLQQETQPLNNQPVWSEVRSGRPQTTQVRGRETDVLIQQGGQTWRALRNGQVAVYGGWAIVVILIAIAAFYLLKGPLRLHSPMTGRKIRRFLPFQQLIHWLTATAFVVLAITGVILGFGKSMLLPILGHTLFAWLAQVAKPLHNFMGPVFAVCTVIIFFTFVRRNFWRAYDMVWIRRFGGLFSGHDVPSGKFNAGEKLWFWGGVLFLGVVVSASGFVLDFPNFDQTRQTMQWANIIHLAGACMFIMAGLGHIYMGTIGMVGAYAAMTSGYVDETWAREHHLYWYEDVKAGRADADVPSPSNEPAAKPRPA
jgi:formate dehydrogenase subunit gamma